MKFLSVEDHTFAVSKPPMLGLFTNIGSQSSETAIWNIEDTGYKPNEDLVDVLTCSKLSADSQGTVYSESYYGMPQLIMPMSVLEKGGPICPELATGTRAQTNDVGGYRRGQLALSTVFFGASVMFFAAGMAMLV